MPYHCGMLTFGLKKLDSLLKYVMVTMENHLIHHSDCSFERNNVMD